MKLFQNQKGAYDYLPSYKRKEMMFTGILILIIVGILLSGLLIGGDYKTIAIMLGILTVLPMSKHAVAVFVVIKNKPLPLEQKKLIETTMANQASGKIAYGVSMTSSETMYYLPCLIMKQDNVYALYPEGGIKDAKKGQVFSYIENILEQKGIHGQVQVFATFQAFEEAIKKPLEQEIELEKAQNIEDRGIHQILIYSI